MNTVSGRGSNVFRQEGRLGKLVTDLGADELVLLRFTGTDYLNELFEYRVEALSTVPNIDFDDLLGTHASVELETRNHGTRWFDGIVTSAHWTGVGENGNTYELTLRPWFFLASKRRDQKIFHEKKPNEIIQEVLAPYGGSYSDLCRKDYPRLEYTVQFGQTDLHFCRQIMERFGINFHFRFEEGNHTLVLTDAEEEHEMIAGSTRHYIGVQGQHQGDEEHFWEWRPQRNITTGSIRMSAYNFKTPNVMMEVEHTGDAIHAHGQIESYDFPGDYFDPEFGDEMSKLRTNQERVGDQYHRAKGDTTSLSAGMRVQLKGNQEEGVASESYVCVEAKHVYVGENYGSGGSQAAENVYEGSYLMMPVTAPLVPARITPPMRMMGPMTSVVVGDGEIDCDEYGRIFVQFHWDLRGDYSMRVRVSQNWAGNGFGGMVIPRVGMEVIVDFINGDPDFPIVTGCVYNHRNLPPYQLPEHATRSTFKTDSSVGTGFNELRFEDKKGEEEVFVHAQKDMNTKVENNRTERINSNHVETVGLNKVVEVGADMVQAVNGSFNLTAGPGAMGTADMSGSDRNAEGIAGSGENWTDSSAAGNFNLTISDNKIQSIGGLHEEQVAENKTTMVGADYNVAATGAINVMAGDSINLVCGSGSIQIKANGEINLVGTRINVTASGNIVANGQLIKLN